MTKKQIEHSDKLGRPLSIDDYVAYPSHNSLSFGRVVKLNNKMVKVIKVPAGKYIDSGWREVKPNESYYQQFDDVKGSNLHVDYGHPSTPYEYS